MAPYTGGLPRGRCPSPGVYNPQIFDDLDELDAAVADPLALPAPGPVELPPPPECASVGFDMAALLRATGGADLASVSQLSLRLLVQDTSLQRLGLSLPSLRELTLDGSHLTSLRDLGTGMGQLRVLRVVRCALSSLDGITGLGGLRELHASHNATADIWTCASLTHLRVLDLRYNNVTSASHAGFLAQCSHFRELSLAGCPGSTHPNYRAEVRRQLPSLILLDGRTLEGVVVRENESEESDDEEEDPGMQEIAASTSRENGIRTAPRSQRQRPATAEVTCNRRELGPRRVMSARPRADTGAFHAEGVTEEEAPSRLTSGEVVCGSLAASLRRRPRTQPLACWGVGPQGQRSSVAVMQGSQGIVVQEPHRAASVLGVEGELSPVESLRDLQVSATGHNGNTIATEELLESARRWREEYSNFRGENRSRWAQEDAEDLIASDEQSINASE